MEKTVRPWVVRVHGIIGRAFPVLGWTRYAAILVIMLNLGGNWLKRTGHSQEMLDSSVIMVWGIINTFTEHHGGPWSHKDMQHTMMGVLWWAGGMLGIFLSRNGQRSFVPAVIIVFTGWGMSAHEQALMISTKIHAMFGYALMAAGVLRIVEVCFVLNDGPTNNSAIRIFQHLPPYLLVLGGTLFMSATDEEMHNADDLGIDHVTYALFDFSLSFLIYLLITFLVHLYSNSGRNASSKTNTDHLQETGYSKLETAEGPESFELTEQDSGDEDAIKIGTGLESEWTRNENASRAGGVRL
ncbi:hypothetical protein P7C73_g3074, partial [Tremellales sp. Uapishka_1]